MMREVKLQALEVCIGQLMSDWLTHSSQGNIDRAESICRQFIDEHKPIFRERLWEEETNRYNSLLICLVLSKGLHDFTQLSRLTHDQRWHIQNKMTETIWIKKCDCKDRIEFAFNYCNHKAIDKVLRSIYGLEEFFQEEFGNGTYASPALVYEKLTCNVCGIDARACQHIEGRLYDGKICRYQPCNPSVNHVGLVKTPRDPRCRIWPWQIQDNTENEGSTIEAMMILTSFSVDDFIWSEE
jgi:hypothetical protein